VRQTLDGSGGAPNSVSYDPWGTPQGGLPLTLSGMGFGFTGELQNSASGMVHLRARWYDANAGRFHARDPFEGWAETPYSQHFYQYAYSNPVNWTDPSGRCTEGWEASCNEPIEWEPITWDEFVGSSSTVIDVTPGVGDVKGLIEVFTGCDIITGEDIGHWRWLGLFGVSELRLLRQAKTTDEFYIPRAIRTELEKRYPGQVSSTTIPPTNDRMMHMAGKRHPSGIVFDHRGFPVFDDVAAYDTKIPHHIATIRDRTAHMQAATRDLHRTIMGGNLNYSFTPVQLQQIARGEARIEGFIWHHHQDRGRMQLVPRNIHQRTGHLGGFELWFGR
jgi:RHS repeat-associated protein